MRWTDSTCSMTRGRFSKFRQNANSSAAGRLMVMVICALTPWLLGTLGRLRRAAMPLGRADDATVVDCLGFITSGSTVARRSPPGAPGGFLEAPFRSHAGVHLCFRSRTAEGLGEILNHFRIDARRHQLRLLVEFRPGRAFGNLVLHDQLFAVLRMRTIPDFANAGVILRAEPEQNAMEALFLMLAGFGKFFIAHVRDRQEFADVG